MSCIKVLHKISNFLGVGEKRREHVLTLVAIALLKTIKLLFFYFKFVVKSKLFKMKRIYLSVAVIVTVIAFNSCTTEDISDSVKTAKYADDDTGGQTGTLPPPPPAPTIP